ncbi:Uncharacterised protein [Actinomyces howellii]|uniref:Uncharacterized protein n=1 Tax=Actinomyces howellii TaxID=52771 RepID=A0A3S4RAD0_9ACTO|nr:Uncharacterised protein [Actinomyces howellii]
MAAKESRDSSPPRSAAKAGAPDPAAKAEPADRPDPEAADPEVAGTPDAPASEAGAGRAPPHLSNICTFYPSPLSSTTPHPIPPPRSRPGHDAPRGRDTSPSPPSRRDTDRGETAPQQTSPRATANHATGHDALGAAVEGPSRTQEPSARPATTSPGQPTRDALPGTPVIVQTAASPRVLRDRERCRSLDPLVSRSVRAAQWVRFQMFNAALHRRSSRALISRIRPLLEAVEWRNTTVSSRHVVSARPSPQKSTRPAEEIDPTCGSSQKWRCPEREPSRPSCFGDYVASHVISSTETPRTPQFPRPHSSDRQTTSTPLLHMNMRNGHLAAGSASEPQERGAEDYLSSLVKHRSRKGAET